MSTPSTTMASKGCSQSCLDEIQRRIYFIQDKLCRCCPTDNRVYAFLILGRGLQAAALGVGIASIVCIFTVGPVMLVGLVSSIALGVLGTCMAGNPQECTEILQIGRPFIPGQPVGLVNSGSNCWLNSGLQILANVPAFEARMRQIPIFAQFLDAYQAARREHHKVAPDIDSHQIRQFVSQETRGAIGPDHFQEDASQLFEYLFQGPHSLYQFEHRLDGVLATPRQEPMIQLDIERGRPIPSFAQLFHNFFNHGTDRGQRQQLFFQDPPNDLLIQLKRFYRDWDGGQGKINDPIHAPVTFQLPASLVRSGTSGAYHCDAFLTHLGFSQDGGHYDAYIKNGNTWWHCSDSRVSEVSAEYAAGAMQYSYILHYTQTDS